MSIHGGDSYPATPRSRPAPRHGGDPVHPVPVSGADAPSPVVGLPAAPDQGASRAAPLHEGDGGIAALLEATAEALPPRPQGRKRARPSGVGEEETATTYPSVATRVCALYETYGDTGRSTRLVRWRARDKAGQFNTRRLRAFQSFVFSAGGCGLSGGDIDELWHMFFEWESDAPAGEGRPKRLRDYFANPHAMRQALGADIDEAVDNDAWYACQLTEMNETYEAYYRAALPGMLAALSRAPKVRYWAKGEEDEGPSDCRETPFDSDAFRLCEEQVIREHGRDAFVLAIHAYSDSCAISSSRGKFLEGPAQQRCTLLNLLSYNYVPLQEASDKRSALCQHLCAWTSWSYYTKHTSCIPFEFGSSMR